MPGDYRAAAPGESGLIRLLAPNPSAMTEAGTNTYIVGHDDVAIIDPGPVSPAHHEAILAAIGGRRAVAVLVTHAHLDHSPAATPLARQLGVPVLAFGPIADGQTEAMRALTGIAGGEGIDRSFAPDGRLRQDESVTGSGWTLRAHWTPGHLSDHLSFEWPEAGAVFTGDTVMGWASTMISPPTGDVGQFMASLDRLEAIPARVFHPGHGAAVSDPAARCRALRTHRKMRETEILEGLGAAPTIPALVERIYGDTPPALRPAAARNVLAHLIDLHTRGLVDADPLPGPDARYTLA